MSFSAGSSAPVNLTLPNWIRGSYMIRDFAKNIVSMKAQCNGNPVLLTKLSKSSWQLNHCEGSVEIEYDVYALDLSVRSAHMDNSHAFFNGTSLYLAVEGKKQEPVTVYIDRSAALYAADWSVKTALTAVETDSAGYGRYAATDYEDAIDHPVEISISHDVKFEVLDKVHSLHFSGDYPLNIDDKCLQTDLSRICAEHAGLFNNELPLDFYLFMTMIVENGYGGLEHKRSTALVCAPQDLPLSFNTDRKAYVRFLGLCSHEYFHLWNIKRITPARFLESALSEEAYSSLLWAFEGITSYYDDLALLRSKCITLQDYLGLMAENLTRYLRAEGRKRQSLAESSLDAWTKFYKQDENVVNAVVSYYTKGAVVAFGLDIIIRLHSANLRSLDDVMRALWSQFGVKGIGINDDELETAIESAAGVNLSDFFNKCLRSTDELPLRDWLNLLGIGINLRAEKDVKDSGGFIDKPQADEDSTSPATTGWRLKPGTADIQFVYNDSAAELAGICPGDTLLAIAGKKVTADNIGRLMSAYRPGDEVVVHVFRRERLHELMLVMHEAKLNTCELYLLDDALLSDAQKKMRENWMRSSAC